MTESKQPSSSNGRKAIPIVHLDPNRVQEAIANLPTIGHMADWKPEYVDHARLDRDRVSGQTRIVCEVVARVPNVTLDGGVMLPEVGKVYTVAVEPDQVKSLIDRVMTDEKRDLEAQAHRAYWANLGIEAREEAERYRAGLGDELDGVRCREIVEQNLVGSDAEQGWMYDQVRRIHAITGNSWQAEYHRLTERRGAVADLESVQILGTTAPRWSKAIEAEQRQREAQAGTSNAQLAQLIAQAVTAGVTAALQQQNGKGK